MGQVIYEKQYVTKKLRGYKSPYRDPFLYVSLHEDSIASFVAAMEEIVSDTLSRDFREKPAQVELNHLIELAGNQFNSNRWYKAVLKDEVVGLVFPQRFPDSLNEGTLFLLGIKSKFRQQGYGKILHAKGLEVLASMDIERYIGSTDIENQPMIEIFYRNQCQPYGIRQLDKDWEHLGWRDRSST